MAGLTLGDRNTTFSPWQDSYLFVRDKYGDDKGPKPTKVFKTVDVNLKRPTESPATAIASATSRNQEQQLLHRSPLKPK